MTQPYAAGDRVLTKQMEDRFEVKVVTKTLTYIEHQCECGDQSCHRLLVIRPAQGTNFSFILTCEDHERNPRHRVSHTLCREDLREMGAALIQMADESLTRWDAPDELEPAAAEQRGEE